MKRTLMILLLPALMSAMAWSMDVSLEMKAKWLAPAEEAFRDVYGGGIGFGAALVLGLSDHWEASLEADWLSRDGELTYTGEPTKVSLFALGADLKYLIPLKGVTLYAGPGIYLHRFSEDNRLGEPEKSGPGFKLKAGALVPVSNSIGLNAFAGYSFCRMTPVEIEIAVGGFEAGLGLRYTFR
ncbi:MAG: hypothetical protein RB296_10535 [Acidobacteriota bacterium]|jgi:hypothetical protein|nr:hypothetical protein [Acidobacteriota bacterium]